MCGTTRTETLYSEYQMFSFPEAACGDLDETHINCAEEKQQ